jgi:hypothetical protein
MRDFRVGGGLNVVVAVTITVVAAVTRVGVVGLCAGGFFLTH